MAYWFPPPLVGVSAWKEPVPLGSRPQLLGCSACPIVQVVVSTRALPAVRRVTVSPFLLSPKVNEPRGVPLQHQVAVRGEHGGPRKSELVASVAEGPPADVRGNRVGVVELNPIFLVGERLDHQVVDDHGRNHDSAAATARATTGTPAA